MSGWRFQKLIDRRTYTWSGFFLLRLACLPLTSTWFVPDEIFQSVEVAHRMVFGRGHLSWEWDRENALRSPLHPLLYAAPFQLAEFLNCDWAFTIIWLPSLIHAVLFSVVDVCYLKFLRRLLRPNSDVRPAMLLYLSNWFVLYCCDRTLANTLETALTLIALPLYHECTVREKQPAIAVSLLRTMLYLLCAAAATIVRPTAALLWAPLFLRDLVGRWPNRAEASRLIGTAAVVGSSVLFASTLLDSRYYCRPTLAMWNFAQFNLLRGGSSHFGTHPWHWYLSCGLPALLTTLFPLLAIVLLREVLELWSYIDTRHDSDHNQDDGFLNIPRHPIISKRYLFASLFYVAVHSAIAHKEHRFLLPVLPLLLPYLAVELVKWPPLIGKHFVRATLIINILLALYLGVVHQRGPYAAIRAVRLLSAEPQYDGGIRVLQLMPCFSMPQQSAFHSARVHIRMLDCSPRIGVERLQRVIDGAVDDEVSDAAYDEADQFHDDPLGWLRARWDLPEAGLRDGNVVVAFEKTYRVIEPFLQAKGFKQASTVFHAHFLMSSRQDHAIVIATKMPSRSG